MKDEELDRLFKQHSDAFSPVPSPQAWQQLEGKLQHKRGTKKGWYWAAASAACIFMLAGIWLNMELSSSYINPNPATTAQQEKPGQLAPPQISHEESEITSPNQKEQVAKAKKQKGASHKAVTPEEKDTQDNASSGSSIKAGNISNSLALQKPTEKNKESSSEPVSKGESLPIVDNKAVRTLNPAEANSDIQTPIALLPEPTEEIIIRYSTEEVESPGYAESAPENELINPLEEKDLSARAVVGFLKKVKENSKGGLADIREAKDDLLSLRLNRLKEIN